MSIIATALLRQRERHEFLIGPRAGGNQHEVPAGAALIGHRRRGRTFGQRAGPQLAPVIFQQAGLLGLQNEQNREFVNTLATGRATLENIDDYLERNAPALAAPKDAPAAGDGSDQVPRLSDASLEDATAQVDKVIDAEMEAVEAPLPEVSARGALSCLDEAVMASMDEEAVEFLVASAKAKLWKHVFRDENAALDEVRDFPVPMRMRDG